MVQKLIAPVIVLFSITSFAAESARPFLGINHEPVSQLPVVPNAPQTHVGIRITGVQINTPAQRSGLVQGDLIVQIDNYIFNDSIDVSEQFRSELFKYKPNDLIQITILRELIEKNLSVNTINQNLDSYLSNTNKYLDSLPPYNELQFLFHKSWDVLLIPVTLGTLEQPIGSGLPSIETTDIGKMLIPPPPKPLVNWEPWVKEVVARYKLDLDYSDLLDRLKTIESGSDPSRLIPIAAIHRNPFFLEPYGRKLTNTIINNRDSNLQNILCSQEVILCMTAKNVTIKEISWDLLSINSDTEGFRKWFESNLKEPMADLAQLYSTYSDEEKAYLLDYLNELTDAFSEQIYLHTDQDQERFKRNLKTIELGQKLDLMRLNQCANRLARFVTETSDQVFVWMSAHPRVREIETKYGKIGFGSELNDRWDKPDFQFIYDLAGDDFYANTAGAANSFDRIFSFVVDKQGNDAYQSTIDGSQACGSPGIGILVDRTGDDTYIGQKLAQGSGFFGAGLLLDNSGNDHYTADEYSQASGLFGLGYLVDETGNDNYRSTVHSQGVGFPNGMGILVDYDGNDFGFCTGKYPTNYGDSGIFDAWSQGCGMGFRTIASGGIGVVVDVRGVDRWEAGNFSQGGGYYYGLGIFRSAGSENDTYIGSRYGQGFSAHQAAGLFIEDGGDDYYGTRQSVVAGLAWDQCVSVFIEDGGNDKYYGGTGFSLGASAHNSFCFFLDKSGRDEYHYDHGPARAGGNDYHGGSSLSVFIDQGFEQDLYTSGAVSNDVELAWPEFGIFRDGRGYIRSPLERPK